MTQDGQRPVLCPRCPLCDSEPHPLSLGLATQWMCPNDDCTVFMWDPTRTLDENLMNAGQVAVTSTPLPGPPSDHPSDHPSDEDQP